MRELDVSIISEKIRELAIQTNYNLSDDVIRQINNARADETGIASDILDVISDNIKIASAENIPLCQDTGLACVFMEIGQDVHFVGGSLIDAVNDGVRCGYKNGYLRKSVVKDPIRRGNTGDNTPAHIVTDIVDGDRVKITCAPKGFGSENMSRIAMLTPALGEAGIKNFVVETVKKAAGNPCPPMVIGVGIGGTFDSCALLAKKALLLPLTEQNQDPFYARMEKELLDCINNIGIGPQGFGGKTTALGVRILTAPTHIAGMPVAVNINCHVSRHKSVIL